MEREMVISSLEEMCDLMCGGVEDDYEEKCITMENLANEIYESMLDMDFMDYLDTKEEEIKCLIQDLKLLEEQGNGTLLNAIEMLVEK